MTKNTTGGNKHKSFAKNKNTHSFTTPQMTEFHHFAIVQKIYGNGLFACFTHNELSLMGHIRNKFKARFKRSNFVSVGSIVLVGLRDWESTPKNADLIYVYDADEIETLQSQYNIQNLIQMSNNMSGFQGSTASSADNDLMFTTHADDVDDEKDIPIINKASSSNTKSSILISNTEIIDIDDI